jgi:hypothetical protein
MKKHKGLIGTARFASINAHLGQEQGRRDDLESIGYLLVYLAKGELPWQSISAKIKDMTSTEELCSDLPDEFCHYLNSVKDLEFIERPDYSSLILLFTNLLNTMGQKNDLMFEWMSPI